MCNIFFDHVNIFLRFSRPALSLLVIDYIAYVEKPSEMVQDPFSGHGSVALAYNLRYIGLGAGDIHSP